MNSAGRIRVGVIGIDHRHAFGMLQSMIDVGCEPVAWWTEGAPKPLEGFLKRFPEIPRVDDRRRILEDPSIDLVLIAAIPKDRARLTIEAMLAGKDVMVDKPGCISDSELDEIERTIAVSGRIWSVDFSERFEVPAVTMALDLVRDGAIGRVVQTVGLGPHRHNPDTRMPWFYSRPETGGVLCDIGSHQIDQFLEFTGTAHAEVVHAASANHANPDHPDFEDFGEIVLAGDGCHGYIRVDWYTADALPTWGDGRLFVLGTEGTIELRKYVDVGGSEGGDHLLLVNGERCEKIDASGAGRPYFSRLADDIRDRTETAMTQAHCIRVTRLAITAQRKADARRARRVSASLRG
jgi:predicted dehydrogenase